MFAEELNKRQQQTQQLSLFNDQLIYNLSAPTMVILPPGQLQMGDIDGVGKSYELPVHLVEIEKPFAMSIYPVTFADFDLFTKATDKQPVDQYKWPRGAHPVINVNKEDAIAYTKWLSKQTKKTYRLPSEAEWEYAARAGNSTKYPWGPHIGVNNAHCKGCGSVLKRNQTAAVGQLQPNDWGLYDLMGNVWEMTADCWNYDYKNAPDDGSAWITGDCSRIVLRGGSWGDAPNDLRSATRLRSYAGARTVNIGFRLVRELSDKEISKFTKNKLTHIN